MTQEDADKATQEIRAAEDVHGGLVSSVLCAQYGSPDWDEVLAGKPRAVPREELRAA